MVHLTIIAVCCFSYTLAPVSPLPTQKSPDYLAYHQRIDDAEQAIAREAYDEALTAYKEVFADYEFVFLRDLKVAAQLASHLDRDQEAIALLQSALAAGWTVKAARKNDVLKKALVKDQWQELATSEDSLRQVYERRIDTEMRDEVQLMFKRDQRKALGAFLKVREKSRQRYALKKFAPHSEHQMRQLLRILKEGKYPGERTIGNNYWVSTVVSHHNSISPDYNQRDTLFAHLRPMFQQAIERGEMSPYELALMDDWRIAVVNRRQGVGYGYLESPSRSSLAETDAKRQQIGLRTVALRNELVAIQDKTGMDFYLPDWVNGAIMIREE